MGATRVQEDVAPVESVLPDVSVMPQPAALRVRLYVPDVPVSPLRLPSVQFWSSLVVNVVPSSGRPMPLSVNCRFCALKPETGLLNAMLSEMIDALCVPTLCRAAVGGVALTVSSLRVES